MTPRIVRGRGVSPGIGIGQAFLMHAEPLPIVPEPLPPERVDEEIQRFHEAVESAKSDLARLRSEVSRDLGEAYAGIFDAQSLILSDRHLVDETCRHIRRGRVSARWALKQVVEELMRRFARVRDDYIRDRGGELTDVQRRLQRLLRGGRADETRLPPGDDALIVVGHSMGPSDAVLLADRRVVGMATDTGGPTSHTAILAQALAVPAIVGVHGLSSSVRPGECLIIDGFNGELELSPDAERVLDARRRQATSNAIESQLVASSAEPTVTLDGVPLVIRTNVEFPGELGRALDFGAKGIGLYRSEFLFLSRAPGLPTADEHEAMYSELCRRVAPEPAVIRTLDLGGEKYFHDVLTANGEAAVRGLRAIRLCLRRPDIFRPQLRGLLRTAAKHANLRVMLPLVTSVAEIQAVRRLLAEEAQSLMREGKEVPATVPLGVMIEVPAAALSVDLLAPESDFFSIGTNDLIQYTLAVDRRAESMSDLYQPEHPAVVRMLKLIVDGAARYGVPLSICGEMAADPARIGLLIALGIRELSVQPRAIATLRQAIRAVDAGAERRRLGARFAFGPPTPELREIC